MNKIAEIVAKRHACLELMGRVRNECLGLDADQWSFRTGRIFGEYLRELEAEEQRIANGKKTG